MPSQLNEPVLEDNYPVYMDYMYVADGKVFRSPIQGDVARLKVVMKAKEIRRCDIYGRIKDKESQNAPAK